MIKKDIYRKNLKNQLKASAKDRLCRFILADGMIRGASVNCTRMVNEMSVNHDLGSIETLILGQSYIAASLLTANLKGRDRVSISIECSGPVKGLDVESNAFGEVRGYLKDPFFSEKLSGRESSISSLFGAGFLTVTKYLEEAKRPYSGKIILEYGSIAEDLANYFLQSEQTPTAFSLSMLFNEDMDGAAGNETDENSDTEDHYNDGKPERYGNPVVDGAGGISLQAMPGADQKIVDEAEEILSSIKSPGAEMASGTDADIIILEKFAKLSPILLGSHRVEFFCRCNMDKMKGYISRLPKDDLEDIAHNGPFPLEIRCHNCNTLYQFSKEDIDSLIR